MNGKLIFLVFIVATILFNCEATDPEVNPMERGELESISILDIVELSTEFEHNAFTDIQILDNELFICFRSSDKHVNGTDGQIQVFKSSDLGESWQSQHTVKIEGVDLRDPKFVLNNKGQLFLYIHGAIYEETSIKGRLDYRLEWEPHKSAWGDFRMISIAPNGGYNGVWPWRIEWSQDTAFVFGYGPDQFDFYYSLDGLDFTGSNLIFEFSPKPNEVTIRHKNGIYYALVRKKGPTYLINSDNPTKKWNFLDSLEWNNIGGPEFQFYNSNSMLIAGRKWASDYNSQDFLISHYNLKTKKLDKLIELPGEMDLGYPGMSIVGDQIFMSYYSTIDDITRTYFAKMQMEFLE